MLNHVQKLWGSEDWLVNSNKYCAKFLNLNHGYECSVHYHAVKDETFYVLGGEIELWVVTLVPYSNMQALCKKEEDSWYKNILAHKEEYLAKLKKITLGHGDQYRLQPYIAHKFTAKTFAAKILEVSTTHCDEDSYRLIESRKV